MLTIKVEEGVPACPAEEYWAKRSGTPRSCMPQWMMPYPLLPYQNSGRVGYVLRIFYDKSTGVRQNPDMFADIDPSLVRLSHAAEEMQGSVLPTAAMCRPTPDEPFKYAWQFLKWCFLGVHIGLKAKDGSTREIRTAYAEALEWALSPEDPAVLEEERRVPDQLVGDAETDDEFDYPGILPNTKIMENKAVIDCTEALRDRKKKADRARPARIDEEGDNESRIRDERTRGFVNRRRSYVAWARQQKGRRDYSDHERWVKRVHKVMEAERKARIKEARRLAEIERYTEKLLARRHRRFMRRRNLPAGVEA